MPDGALHACTHRQCARLLHVGERCPEHQAPWQWRDPDASTTARGYGRAWVLVRASVLKRDGYLCQPCARLGRMTRATSVDHVVPLVRGGAALDAGNLESVCEPHHRTKSARERRRG